MITVVKSKASNTWRIMFGEQEIARRLTKWEAEAEAKALRLTYARMTAIGI